MEKYCISFKTKFIIYIKMKHICIKVKTKFIKHICIIYIKMKHIVYLLRQNLLFIKI